MQQVSKDVKGAKLIDVYGDDANFAEYNTDMIWAVLTKRQAHIGSSPKEIIKKLETHSLQQDLEAAVKGVFALCDSCSQNAPARWRRILLCFRQTRRIRAIIY